jgi:hypothetical protein
MNSTRILSPLLLLLPLVTFADADTDAVNERLPVRKAELESHWQVDCLGSWSAVTEAFEQGPEPADCRPAPEQRRQLELCAFIYQPPGEISRHDCPDYRGLLRLLDATPARDCDQLAGWFGTRTDCADNTPTNH